MLFGWNEINVVLFKNSIKYLSLWIQHNMLFHFSCIDLWFHSNYNLFKLFVQIIKAIHWSKNILPFISYLNNKSSFFFPLVEPVIFHSFFTRVIRVHFSKCNWFYYSPWVQIFLIYLLWWCQHFHVAWETETKNQ